VPRPQPRQPEDTVALLHRRLRTWGKASRRSLPWRCAPTPFRVLIAELCLRKTGARLAEPVYRSIIHSCPTVQDLARAHPKQLEPLFRPIGLTSRSSGLIDLARDLVRRHGGEVPSTYEELVALPGVGPYIANAVLCFAFKRAVPIVDGSVKRLLGRLYGPSPLSERSAWRLAERLVPRRQADLYNYTLLDLAAKLCRPTRPLCHDCPLRETCEWYRREGRP